MQTNFKVGDTIISHSFAYDTKGEIKAIKGKRLFVLMSTTTTGLLSEFSLRNDNSFILSGWSKEERFWGGYFYNK